MDWLVEKNEKDEHSAIIMNDSTVFEQLSFLSLESSISGRKGEAKRSRYINEDKDDPVLSGDPRKSAKETEQAASVERGVSLEEGQGKKRRNARTRRGEQPVLAFRERVPRCQPRRANDT